MKNFQRLYVKYLIKNPALFYGFIALFLAVFIGMSLTIKLDVVKSYPAKLTGNMIIVEKSDVTSTSYDCIYYYTNRNEKIYKAKVAGSFFDGGSLIINLIKNEETVGDITIDLIVGKQTLLERIFVKAGKS